MSIEYEQRLFTKQPIDFWTDNIVERLKVSLIEKTFDNWMYEINPLNADFDDLRFDGDDGWSLDDEYIV